MKKIFNSNGTEIGKANQLKSGKWVIRINGGIEHTCDIETYLKVNGLKF